MSVRRRKWTGKDGQHKERWIVDIEIRLPDGSKLRARKPSPVNTKEGAKAWERKLRQAVADGTYHRGKEQAPAQEIRIPTVAEFAPEFLETYAKTNNRPSGVSSKKSILKCHIVPHLGALKLNEVAPQVEPFKAAMKAQGLANKSINNVLTCLSKMLRYAEEDRHLTQSTPKMRKLRVVERKVEFLTFEEYAEALAAARVEPEWYTIFVVAGDTGLRRGELLGLDWEDIDLKAGKHGQLTVRRSIWQGYEGPPKGGKPRTIPLTKRAREALTAHRHLTGPHVFCARSGKRLCEQTLRAPLDRIQERARLRRFGWHALRHTFCSHLAMRGAPARVIMELAGHTSLTITLRYMHLAPDSLQSAVDLLDQPAPNGTRAAHDTEEVA